MPLHLQVWSCNCGHVFCDAHRRPEQHKCPFDYKAAQRAKLRRENQQVRKEPAECVEFKDWHAEYSRDHTAGSVYSISHAIGFGMALVAAARALLRLAQGYGVIDLFCSLLMGALLSYGAAHGAPAFYLHQKGRAARPALGGVCRFCAFSADVRLNPTFACLAEVDNIKALCS